MICKFDIMSTIVDELRANNFIGNVSIRHIDRINEISVTLTDTVCKIGITRAIGIEGVDCSTDLYDRIKHARIIIRDMVNTLKEEMK